jgi:hypothetical protein
MFGSKNKTAKSQVEVSIETMEGNLKGEGGKTTMIEYGKLGPTQDTGGNSTPPPAGDTTKESATNDATSKKTPFKSPFEGGDLPIGKPGSAEGGTVGQGSFPASVDNSATDTPKREGFSVNKNANGATGVINPPKKDDSAFLHQAVDEKMDSKAKVPSKQLEKMPTKKKGGMNSFLLIVLFIALLAGILFGGYYFYMNKGDNSPKVEKPITPIKKPVEKPNTPIEKPIQEEKAPTVPKVEKLITSAETFNDDLAKFILDLKQRRNLTDLQNGIFISPMATIENPLLSSELLKALHMTAYFNQADLKDSCKMFAVEDNGEIRLAVIFELAEIADEKLVKDRVIKNEKDLMMKMSYLFVDGMKPTVPTEISFTINDNNINARYENYTPSIDTSSVDWNILDLGKGKLVYFATSRKTAKILTDYFMRTVTK